MMKSDLVRTGTRSTLEWRPDHPDAFGDPLRPNSLGELPNKNDTGTAPRKLFFSTSSSVLA